MKKVLMVGPSIKLKGGIATVIKNYQSFDFFNKDFKVNYMGTIFTDNKFVNILIFPIVIVRYFIAIFNKDIIHIHMASYGSFKRKAILVRIAKMFDKNVILHVHGAEFHLFYEKSNDKFKMYIKHILDKVDYVIALSEEWKMRLGKITNTDIVVIYNSVNIASKNLYNQLALNITFMGRMDARKGVYDLLDIATAIKKIDRNLVITLCGDGDKDEVESIVRKRMLDNVVVLGWIDKDKKEDVLNNTLINILPSYNEGMPMSILEAMGRGIPTISTIVGGIPEIIKNNENGFIIEPGNKREMVRLIEFIVKDNSLKNKISKNAYDTINKKFNLNTHVNLLIDLYKRSLI